MRGVVRTTRDDNDVSIISTTPSPKPTVCYVPAAYAYRAWQRQPTLSRPASTQAAGRDMSAGELGVAVTAQRQREASTRFAAASRVYGENALGNRAALNVLG